MRKLPVTMFNVTHMDFNVTCLNDSCMHAPQPSAHLKWPLLALMFVIMCTACGNLMVCVAVCWERRLQNMTNYFLMSLAIADFLVSIIVMPFGMVVEIYGYFPIGSQFCAFWVTMDVMMCTASIWHMCTMSLDRYITLKYPMQYGRNKTKTMVAVKIVFVWIVSITISSPMSIYSLVDATSVFNDGICMITIKEFVIYGSIFAFYIPLGIMMFTYILTIRILWKNQHMMKAVARSQFRMRSRNSSLPTKTCHVTALLSPPSSDSRRESHTFSSIACTPLTETNIQKDWKECKKMKDMKIPSLKNAISNMPLIDMYFNASQKSDHAKSQSFTSLQHENKNECIHILHNKDNSCEKDIRYNEITQYNTDHDTIDMFLDVPTATFHIQSPSSDNENEICSTLLHSSTEILSSSFSNYSMRSRFRHRTNTDVSSKSYLSIHQSLKIPKTCEKLNLQSSVSCSNFTNSKTKGQGFPEMLGIHGSGLNRDYKSLEWCHHFYEIQQEMDECLQECKNERKFQNMNFKAKKKVDKLTSTPLKDMINQNSIETQDSGIASSIKQNKMKSTNQMYLTESYESTDENYISSENGSDLLSINLHPKSVYTYKLDANEQEQPLMNTTEKKDALGREAAKKGLTLNNQAGSTDSDKSSEHAHRIIRKSGSIKRFLDMWQKGSMSSKNNTNERKASKVLGIIFAVFVILWSPFFIANILSVTCETCQTYITGEMMSAYVWMGYIASLANPIIYTIFNTAFRRTFLQILSCHICTRKANTSARRSTPSYAASFYNDRRLTLTAIIHGNNERIPSEIPLNQSTGK